MSSTLTRRMSTATAAALATGLALTGCSGGSSGGGDAADYPTRPIELIVPAAAGGGWDLTGRAIQQVIQEQDLISESLDVRNVEGGGGAAGLSELISRNAGNPETLMVAGLVMIGALEQADSPLQVTQATTIATLTSEPEAFVVRADSPFQTIDDVVTALQGDPGAVTFGGGTAGGSDQIVTGLMAQAADVDPGGLRYVGYSGGGEATAGILSGDVEVGVSGLSEFEGQLEAGEMRLLALSNTEPTEVLGAPAPTLADAGLDVDFVNWRALFAPPGLDDAEVQAITDLVDEVHESDQWAQLREQNGWTDFYTTGDEAQEFIASETERISGVLTDLGL